MKLYIKYTDGIEWEPSANEELNKLGLSATALCSGMIELYGDVTAGQKKQIKERLSGRGLELVENKNLVLVERMKQLIARLVFGDLPEMNYSNCISEGLAHNYTYLSNLFSLAEGVTVQQFIISKKIERARLLMVSGGLSITEIAYRLNYSSVAHLSNQFKKINGQSPTCYLRDRCATIEPAKPVT